VVDLDTIPPRVPARLRASPKIRQVYWCDFPMDAQLPEFWKTRSVIIISYKNTLSGAVTIIPCSSQPQEANPWAHRLNTTIDDRPSWAICDKPSTVAVSRLSVDAKGIRRLSEAEFNDILGILFRWLPRLSSAAHN
jgi:mRNA interferase MazF